MPSLTDELLVYETIMDPKKYKAVDNLFIPDSNNTDYTNGILSFQGASALRDHIHTLSSWSITGGLKITAPAGVTWTGNPATDGIYWAAGGTAGLIAGITLQTSDGQTLFEDTSSKVISIYNFVRKLQKYSSAWAQSHARELQFSADTANNLTGGVSGYISSTSGTTFTVVTPAIVASTAATNAGVRV